MHNFSRQPAATVTFGRNVRLGFGAVLGVVLGFGLCIRFAPTTTLGTVLLFVASVLVCAFLAARYGDSFWNVAVNFLRW